MKSKVYILIFSILLIHSVSNAQNHILISDINYNIDTSQYNLEQDITYSGDLETDRLHNLINEAKFHHYKTELNDALKKADEARLLALKLNKDKEYAECLFRIASIYVTMGTYTEAIELLYEALDIIEKHSDPKTEEKILTQIGIIYSELEQYEKAYEYYDKAYTICINNNFNKRLGKLLNNISLVYANTDRLEEFRNATFESIKINKEHKNNLWLGHNYFNLGFVYSKYSQLDSAMYYFRIAEEIYEAIHSTQYLNTVYIQYANYYLNTGNVENYVYYAEKAFNIAIDNNIKKQAYLIARALNGHYLDLGDTNKAYYYLTKEHEFINTMNVSNSQTKLLYHDFRKQVDKSNQQQELEDQRKGFLYKISLICLISTILVALLIIRKSRLQTKYEKLKKAQLEGDLANKKREFTTHTLGLMRKNESLLEISESLKSLKEKSKKEDVSREIKQLSSKIERLSQTEIWQDFEKRFNDVHQDFYTHLYESFPNLSPQEKRLCAFLKLDMSSKDISELTGSKIESVEKARTRLRKKLGLTNTSTNLVTFLSKF